jgi:hypothetical protein
VRETTATLARLFFRRFIENDLISPDADRHQTLAVATACVVSFSLVVTMLLALKYLTALPTPGQVALLSLDDKFLYLGWSMAVMALMTLAEWDALALDARDAAILGQLPLGGDTILRAKALALLIFASGAVITLNLVPTIVYSSAVVSKLVVGPIAYANLIAVHATTTIAAGSFGFLSVLGLRELLHALLGTALFRKISVVLQALLVVCVVVFLCMLPTLSNRVGRTRLAPEHMSYAMPPLWFLGLYELGAGHVIDGLPRESLPRRLAPFDRASTEIYRSRRAEFESLAAAAVLGLTCAAAIAVAAYAWNNRRLPPPLTPHRVVSTLTRRSVSRWAGLAGRHPLQRAGFFFTLSTLSRNAPHRLSMAVAVALSLAFAALAVQHELILAVQPVVLLVLFTAFRYAARLPGDLRANWAFQLCWAGDPIPYTNGVKRAALASIGIPAIATLFPLHVALLGWEVAARHAGIGVFMAAALVELQLLGFRTLPFASSYVGGGNLKGWLPAYAIVFLPLVHVLAALERIALNDTMASVILIVAMVCLRLAAQRFSRRQQQAYGPVDFHELSDVTQRLDLSA